MRGVLLLRLGLFAAIAALVIAAAIANGAAGNRSVASALGLRGGR